MPQPNLIIRLAHRLGISPLMMRMRREARKKGARLHFGYRGMRWEKDDFVIFFPKNKPYRIPALLEQASILLSRTIPILSGGKKIVDLRSYPMPFLLCSGRQVWLPGLIELTDNFAGYLARGAPRPGDVVLDAGAFCGEVAIELALLVGPRGHVFALEPDPANSELLQRNLAIHHIENVTILPYALWDRTTELVFTASGRCGSSVRGSNDSAQEPAKTITVSAIAPAELFARIGRIPDFIKMDIEGAEVEAVSALAPLLAAAPHPVRLAIASYHLREGRPTHELITPMLVAAGLQVETGNPEHVTTWALKP